MIIIIYCNLIIKTFNCFSTFSNFILIMCFCFFQEIQVDIKLMSVLCLGGFRVCSFFFRLASFVFSEGGISGPTLECNVNGSSASDDGATFWGAWQHHDIGVASGAIKGCGRGTPGGALRKNKIWPADQAGLASHSYYIRYSIHHISYFTSLI